MRDFQIQYLVEPTDANRAGDSASFAVLSGLDPADPTAFTTELRELAPGTLVGELGATGAPGAHTILLHEVVGGGRPLNELDRQPGPGDTVTVLCSPVDVLFQAGFHAVIAVDGIMWHVATSLTLALLPVATADLSAELATLRERVAALEAGADG